MDALETTQTNPAPAAATTPLATPTPAPTPTPVADSGTSSSGNIVSILKNMNWIEVGFGVLGAAALYYAIYYYRYNINNQKSFELEMKNKIDELNIKIADINSVITKQETNTPSAGGDPFISFVK